MVYWQQSVIILLSYGRDGSDKFMKKPLFDTGALYNAFSYEVED